MSLSPAQRGIDRFDGLVMTGNARELTLPWHLWPVNTLAKGHDEASGRLLMRKKAQALSSRQATSPTLVSSINIGSCWIPEPWDLPRSYNLIVVTLFSLKPFFFKSLKKESCFSENAWSIRPRHPIRAWTK